MDSPDKLELHIAICDDEPEMINALQARCEAILRERYQLRIHTACTMRDLLNEGVGCQIALLDVQLAEGDGIELARELLSRNPSCRILFVSGYVSSVSQVYNVPHLCFILKDQVDQYLPEFLTRAAREAAAEAGQFLTVQCGKAAESLELRKLLTMERNVHQTTIRASDGSSWVTREKLADLLARIDSPDFIRCHVSFVVNLCHVSSISKGFFQMDDGTSIPISRPNEKASRDAFFRYLCQQA